MIWSLVPPEDRLPRMWLLSTKSSFFAQLFLQMPVLWMHWFVQPYPRCDQDHHTVCAIRMWCYFHGNMSTSLPVSVYAVEGTTCTHSIMDCVPFAALPFIRHVTIRVSESILHCPVGYPDFMASLPALRSVWLNVYNGISRMGNGRRWTSNTPLIERDLPPSAQLASLCLDGLAVRADATLTLPLAFLKSLTFLDLATGNRSDTASLVDILSRTPLLTTLCIRSDRGQPPPSNFWPSPGTSITSMIPLLRHIELSGDLTDLYPFMELITPDSYPHLESVVASFHIWTGTCTESVFGRVAVLESELASSTGTITLRGASMSIATKRAPTANRPFTCSCSWRLLTEIGELWVRYVASRTILHALIWLNIYQEDDMKDSVHRAFYEWIARSVSRSRFAMLRCDEAYIIQAIIDAGPLPCLADILSLEGDRSEFSAYLGLIQELPSRFPCLTSVYWDSATDSTSLTAVRYDTYSSIIADFPLRHYTSCERMVDVFVRCSRVSSSYSAQDHVWIHVLWALDRPDLARVNWISE